MLFYLVRTGASFNSVLLPSVITMVKSRTRKCSTSSSEASSGYELELMPPAVPEPPESYEEYTSDVSVEVPYSEEIIIVDMRRVKDCMKRLLATGELDLFIGWIKEVPYFAGSKKAVRRPRAFAIRGAVMNQFMVLFPGYMPVRSFALVQVELNTNHRFPASWI